MSKVEKESITIHKKNSNNLQEEIIAQKVVRKERSCKFYAVIPIQNDENSLFRSISFAQHCHEEQHSEIRKRIVDYVTDNWEDCIT